MSFERLRAHCASLPGTTIDVKWGADECYSLGGRMFAVFGIAGGRARCLSFKVDAGRFLELTDRDGVVPAPYLARAHWIQLERADAMPLPEVKRLVARSHELVAAKLTRKARAAALAPAR
jgi:predicted DNA-binding protein (MmcQ/YjbR family)